MQKHLSHNMRFLTMWYMIPTKPQISLHSLWLEYSMSVKLLAEHYLEILSLKGGCKSPSESTLVKMSHCWKSHVTAHFKDHKNTILTSL